MHSIFNVHNQFKTINVLSVSRENLINVKLNKINYFLFLIISLNKENFLKKILILVFIILNYIKYKFKFIFKIL
jgi:hypothetical protein